MASSGRFPLAALFKWGGRKEDPPSSTSSVPVSEAGAEAIVASKVLPRVLKILGQVEAPVLMDLGPVVGPNIAFFGEELSCKIFVEDLFAVVEAHGAAGPRVLLPGALTSRISHPPESIDGILCWDLFDYLDKPSAQVLAARLAALLKSGGLLYGFFGSKPGQLTQYTRYTVEGSDRLRLRTAPATPTPRHTIVNRDIIRMFEGLVVSEYVLLKSNARETLFRKP